MNTHWLTRQRLLTYPLACLTIYVVSAVIIIFRLHGGVDPQGNPIGCDFISFWSASHLALEGHPLTAYDPHAIVDAEKAVIPGTGYNAVAPWYYPPTFYLVVLPLALLPYFLSLALFEASTLLLYVAVLKRILPGALSWLPILAFGAVPLNMFEGQNGFLTAGLFGLALVLLPNRPALAGIPIGLLTIKPHLGLLLPLALLCGRCWRTLFSATVSAALFLLVSVGVMGTATLEAFFNRIPQVTQWIAEGKLPLQKMPTVYAFLRLLGISNGLALALHGILAAVVAAAVAWTWLRCRDHALRAAALVSGTLLISPYLFDYDLTSMGLALAWLAVHGLRTGWHRGEREWMVLAWVLPALMVPLHHYLHLQLAPFVTLGVLVMVLRRALTESAVPPQASTSL